MIDYLSIEERCTYQGMSYRSILRYHAPQGALSFLQLRDGVALVVTMLLWGVDLHGSFLRLILAIYLFYTEFH